MSAEEYNSLLFEISQRLDELNVGRKLLVICRGKVAPRSEKNMPDAFSLFEELEEKGFLGPDSLDVLKGMLKGVEEWSLFENVKKYESKRKEYNDLLEQIIRVLDELNDLERLVYMCRGKIAEDRHGDIHDVRCLFKELENNNYLGVYRLGILKEILTQTEKSDLLKEVEEFEERRNREDEFERRKAQAAAVVSSVSDNLTGVLNMKTVFKVVGGGIVVYSAYELLRRGSTYDQLITAINNCVLPAGAKLIQITEGSVYLKVQAESVSALNTLWNLYKDGTLKARLQALLVTDEMKELAGGEQVEVIVTIDEHEYEKARSELTNKVQEGPDGREDEQLKYLHQDKLSYIQRYLERAEDTDTYSITTEASDSGMPGSHGAPSEFGMEETSDSTAKLCLKDLSKAVTAEVASRLESDKDALERFYKSYGLDPDKMNPERLRKVSEFFPDTPVKVLKDVFESLQLFDLVELLEQAVKPRTLRPALSLKEIGKLPNATNRPTKNFTEAEVLIINLSKNAADDNAEGIGSFFKAFNSRNEVTTFTAKPTMELLCDMVEFVESMRKEDEEDRFAEISEMNIKELLGWKIPSNFAKVIRRRREYDGAREEIPFNVFQKKEPAALKKELEELMEKREQWKKERKPKIEKEIKQKEEELQKENKKFEMAVSTFMDKWIQHAQDEGEECTLFVVLTVSGGKYAYLNKQLETMIGRCLKEKLAFIPNTKLVITSYLACWRRGNEEIPRETLHVDCQRFDFQETGIVSATMLKLLNKRWQALDLISVMMELQRTVPIKLTPQYQLVERGLAKWGRGAVEVHENLSCLPRLQKT